jgi:hypothetical protein
MSPVRQTTCTSPLDGFCRKEEGGSREGGVGGGIFERIERERPVEEGALLMQKRPNETAREARVKREGR